jgi:hypothetical protein
MNLREIRISEILEETGSVKGLEGKILFRFSFENLSNEQMSEAVEALCGKLLKDKFRSKEVYGKNGSLDLKALAAKPEAERIVDVDLAGFFIKRAGKRLAWADLEADEILTRIEQALSPEKLQALITAMSKRQGR